MNAGFVETQAERRGHPFIPENTETWAALRSTEGTRVGSKIIFAHYFVAGADWWVVEADPLTGRAFGYVDLGLGEGMAEWGWIDLVDVESVVVAGLFPVERDLHWEPVPARESLPVAAWAWNDPA